MYDGMALCEGDSCLGMGVGCRECWIGGAGGTHDWSEGLHVYRWDLRCEL